MILEASRLALPGRLASTDLELRAGELVCLIGPNGSGKTSLLHAIAGIGRPEGRVRLDGTDLHKVPPPLRPRHMAYLPASRDLPWPIPVRDVVRLGLAGSDVDRLQPVMEMMGIDGLAGRRVDRLSTGERSRVLVARALVSQPRLLLLDEPSSNLDPLWQLRLMDHLAELGRRDDHIVVVAMHDLELAGRYADRLLIMADGRVAADGTPELLLGGDRFKMIFGVEKSADGWRPLTPPEDLRSSR